MNVAGVLLFYFFGVLQYCENPENPYEEGILSRKGC
jgi:hypothetical protein